MVIKDRITETFIKLNLSSITWKVLWIVIVKNSHNQYKITLAEFSEITGMTHNSIAKILKTLKEKNIIISQGRRSGMVCFNENIKEWLLEKSIKKEIPKKNLLKMTSGFQKFISMYPKKIKIVDAMKEWNKLNPNTELEDVIIKTIEKFKQSVEWIKDNGKYIPSPVNFLSGKRWLDELTYQKDWRET